MTSARFAVRTTSYWQQYGAFLVLCTMLMISVWVFAATAENLFIAGASMLIFSAISTPLFYLATRQRGNWIELAQDHLLIRKFWWSSTNVDYAAVLSVTDGVRHSPFFSFVSKGLSLYEEHIDLRISVSDLRDVWRYSRWMTGGGVIHISPVEPEAFLEALRQHVPAKAA